MTKHTADFTGDDTAAIAYIRERGYASYSSLKNVRDKQVPVSKNTVWGAFGSELHSRLLERKKLQTLSAPEEYDLSEMLKNLRSDPVVQQLMKGAQFEREFKKKIRGLTLYGFIDIDGKAVADLKSTRHTSIRQFISEMDFLQAAVYLAVTGKKDFYYIGISKNAPFDVMVFNVNQYPKRLALAFRELYELIPYVLSKL